MLSGGASLGAIQVGMLRALLDEGIVPDTVIGTSVGALSGAFLASHGAVPETAEELATLWLGLRRGDVFPVEPFTGLLGGIEVIVLPPRRHRRPAPPRAGVGAPG